MCARAGGRACVRACVCVCVKEFGVPKLYGTYERVVCV